MMSPVRKITKSHGVSISMIMGQKCRDVPDGKIEHVPCILPVVDAKLFPNT